MEDEVDRCAPHVELGAVCTMSHQPITNSLSPLHISRSGRGMHKYHGLNCESLKDQVDWCAPLVLNSARYVQWVIHVSQSYWAYCTCLEFVESLKDEVDWCAPHVELGKGCRMSHLYTTNVMSRAHITNSISRTRRSMHKWHEMNCERIGALLKSNSVRYGVATISRLLKIIGFFCKRAL